MQKKNHHKEQLLANITELQLEIKKLDHEIKKLQDDFKTCKHKVEKTKFIFYYKRNVLVGSRVWKERI